MYSCQQAGGADGIKIAVLRKGRARLVKIWAAAHWPLAALDA